MWNSVRVTIRASTKLHYACPDASLLTSYDSVSPP